MLGRDPRQRSFVQRLLLRLGNGEVAMSPHDAWILTRPLQAGGRDIDLKLGQPHCVADDEWRCPYEVAGIAYEAFGLDALQALVMALTGVRVALDGLAGPLKWRGGRAGDPGVPRMVPQGLGLDFTRKLEALIDAEIGQFVANAEAAAEKRNT